MTMHFHSSVGINIPADQNDLGGVFPAIIMSRAGNHLLADIQ